MIITSSNGYKVSSKAFTSRLRIHYSSALTAAAFMKMYLT